jgi:exosortase
MAGERAGWLTLIAALWVQLYAACVPTWLHGDYYSYGWYIGPVAAFFAWRVRAIYAGREPSPVPAWLLVAGGAGLCAVLAVIRVLQKVDDRWTLPLWGHAAVAAVVSLAVAHRYGGAAAVRRSLPILVFALTAMPLPTVIESALVRGLTSSVVATTTVILNVLGYEAQAVGDQIASVDGFVRVTEGCSGIRSAQSFFMAALFFGEWMRLRDSRRVVLLLLGWVTAWALNVVRATGLAAVHFSRGHGVGDDLHDPAGVVSFVIGSIILYFIACRLDGAGGERRWA